MARQSNIERYGLERVANGLLAPKPDKTKRTLGEITEQLTKLARKKAREENPDMAPSLLEDIKITPQALLRYQERSKPAAARIIERNERLATEAADATLNGLGTLLRIRTELWAIWRGKLANVTDKEGKVQYGQVDTLEAQRVLGRLETVAKGLLELELMGQDPALFQRFLKVLDKGVATLFGPEATDKLKEWLQDQDEFKDVAIALGWVSEDEEGAPPTPEGGSGVVM